MTKQAEREYPLKIDQSHLFQKPYNCPRVFREFGLVLELFQTYLSGGSILDMGCGPGWTTLLLARAGYEMTGIDISERMIEIARERTLLENVEADFHVADMEEFELEKRDFNGVLLFDCLHHCPQYEKVLQRAAQHLQPGGVLLMMETTWLHRYSPHAREHSRQFGVTEQGFTRGQIRRGLQKAGFHGIKQFHDPGPLYRGFGGFLWATMRLWFGYASCFPQSKNIFLAVR
ncbi:MAG: class I SAM-dependent methyltransferase [Gemmataceae bacterium]